jgi:hypothetical protein
MTTIPAFHNSPSDFTNAIETVTTIDYFEVNDKEPGTQTPIPEIRHSS